ncbi:MAG: hypothetical protein H0T76_12370, partial [Nannocystis sp.]
MIDEDERWVPGLLREHGYRGLQRQHGWHECLLWREDERWVGHGEDPASALAHVLAQMFPSAAARALWDAASAGQTSAAAAAAASTEPDPAAPTTATPE